MKKKNTNIETPQSIIQVDHSVHYTVTNEADPNDEWSADSTDANHTIRGIRLVNDQNYLDLTVPFVVEPGKDYFLLYATYTTGDSFSSHGGRLEFIDLFSTYEKGQAAKTEIQKSQLSRSKNKDWKQQHGFNYTREDGSKISAEWAVWDGYFEHLERLCVVPVNCWGKD